MSDSSQQAFPLAPAAFRDTSRTVEAGAGFDWLRQGWALFTANPGVWLAAAVIFLLLTTLRWIFPIIGPLAANLLTPVLVAGMASLSSRMASGADGNLDELFAGFRRNSNTLVLLGLVLALVFVAIDVAAFVISGGGLAGGLLFGATTSIGLGLGMAMGGFLISWLLSMVLMVPIIMAFWFAPLLVYFHGLGIRQALEVSFLACARNWIAFLVLGIMISILAFFAALPMGLGFLVLVPVLAGALYASYRDVFVGT